MTRMSRVALTALVGCLLVASQAAAQQAPKWQPYVEGTVRGSTQRWIGQGNLFVPVFQDQDEMMFLDMRGLWTDNSAAEGNWGLAYRKMLQNEYILGVYGFYDLRESAFNNVYHQGTIGAELLAVDWGLRANGYLPDQGVKAAAGAAGAYASGGAIFVRPGLEAAYWGTDAEAEVLLWDRDANYASTALLANTSAELWAAAGVYHFDNGAAGFDSFTGPRVRVEMRLYDLPLLGNDSRLVLAGQYEHDDQRGSVGTGMLNVRIPLGTVTGNSSDYRLTGLNRRMVNPIVRDIDVVTNAGAFGAEECAMFASNGQEIANFIVLDANDDIVSEVPNAGENSLVVLDGSAGEFYTYDAVFLQDGQVVMGGGSQLEVVGCETGATAFFSTGTRPTVIFEGFEEEEPFPGGENQFVAARRRSYDVFQMNNNSTLQGVDIVGGDGGIVGYYVDNFQIIDNTVTEASVGVYLFGAYNGYVANNNASGNWNDGFLFSNYLESTTVTGNTANNNGNDGFYVDAEVYDSTVSNNTATQNEVHGFDFLNDIDESTISDNTAAQNGQEGFNFEQDIDYSTIKGNVSMENGDDGFDFEEELYATTVTGNKSIGNDGNGFWFDDDVEESEISLNLSQGNNGDGFGFDDGVEDSLLQGNRAIGNNGDGFYFEEDVWSITLDDNTASGNAYGGFFFDYGIYDSTISNNVASGNGDDGFYVYDYIEDTSFSKNYALGNGGAGFIFDYDVYDSTFSDNVASDNEMSGMAFTNGVYDTLVTGNKALRNGQHGFIFDEDVAGITFSGNTATNNVWIGVSFFGDVEYSEISNNVASSNGNEGFLFNEYLYESVFSGNTTNGNGSHGVYIASVDGNSSVSGNTASGNSSSGFVFNSFASGSLTDNVAKNNANHGFQLLFPPFGGSSSGNTATGNGDNTLP